MIQADPARLTHIRRAADIPAAVAKVEKLAKATGLSKTAVVERAVDRMLSETGADAGSSDDRLTALLAQLDRIPERADTGDPLPWDDNGLPR